MMKQNQISQFYKPALLSLLAFAFSHGTAQAEVCQELPGTELKKVTLKGNHIDGDTLTCEYDNVNGKGGKYLSSAFLQPSTYLEIIPSAKSGWDGVNEGECKPSPTLRCEFQAVDANGVNTQLFHLTSISDHHGSFNMAASLISAGNFIESSDTGQKAEDVINIVNRMRTTVHITRYNLTCKNGVAAFFQNDVDLFFGFGADINREGAGNFYLSGNEHLQKYIVPDIRGYYRADAESLKKILDAQIGESFCSQ